MATTLTISLLLLLVLLHGLPSLHSADAGASSDHRSLFAIPRTRTKIADCRDAFTRSQCLQSTKCRWCRSESLDDACFASTEAWRLPQQVFSCD